ncbi:28227_t:CDS:2 [Dentiscutata erythropus]|uniref:28227_t:CDS:1 n=1 Tax=Dentiscutata erythropus TaxID=1348616 RepID=A0A9N9IDE7_9GLOM|nr:28227_t:CDS:2 [Dentiscutata erythropus]
MTIVNNHPEETREALLKSDTKLSSGEVVVDHRYAAVASEASIQATKTSLEANLHEVTVVETKEEAFEFLKNLIPKGASINNGHSTTLEEIGFISYLKNATEWENVHAQILAETDYAKQAELRRTKGFTVDYYLSSASAITEDGIIVGCDWSGTRVGGWNATAGKVVIVSGTNKIVKNEQEANERIHKYTLELESARVRLAYKVDKSNVANYVLVKGGNPFAPKRYHVVLIKESLGY